MRGLRTRRFGDWRRRGSARSPIWSQRLQSRRCVLPRRLRRIRQPRRCRSKRAQRRLHRSSTRSRRFRPRNRRPPQLTPTPSLFRPSSTPPYPPPRRLRTHPNPPPCLPPRPRPPPKTPRLPLPGPVLHPRTRRSRAPPTTTLQRLPPPARPRKPRLSRSATAPSWTPPPPESRLLNPRPGTLSHGSRRLPGVRRAFPHAPSPSSPHDCTQFRVPDRPHRCATSCAV